MQGLAIIALTAFLLLGPETARACAVCTSSTTDEVRYAFIWTTGFLSVLPLGMIAGLVWFLRRRAREIAAKREPSEIGLSRQSP